MKFNPEYDYGKEDLSIEENLVYWKFAELIKNLITLSGNSEKQMEIIGAGAVCDEMAEEFDTYFTLSFRSYVKNGLLTENQVQELLTLDTYLEERSGDKCPDFWDDSQLNTNPEWDVAREKAQNILQLLGFQYLTIEFDRTDKYHVTGDGKRLLSQWTKTRLVDNRK